MRNPDRIDDYMKRIGECWKKVPDWRLGQFIVNVLGTYKGDLFFPEDEKLVGFIEDYFKKGDKEDV